MTNPKFELYQSKNGEYRFRLRARNGQIILSGEGYSSEAGCRSGIASVKKNAGDDKRFKRQVSSSGKPYFELVAGNNEPIGCSQMYASKRTCEAGIAAVARVAAAAPIEELG